MARTAKLNRRGRRPSLRVAARKVSRLQTEVKRLLGELEDLENRLVKLDALLEASRRAETRRSRDQTRRQSSGIRGKGPNVRDLAYDLLARRKRPMSIQDIADAVLKSKRGVAGANFTQNLGAALARDPRFSRVGRGVYTLKR